MHILLIAPQPFYEDRGTPIVVHDTLVALSELGFEIDLATFPVGSDIALNGVRVLRTVNPLRYRSVPVGLSLRKILLDICLLATVLRLNKRNQYDLIHGVEEGAAMALICKALTDIPVIYDMQSRLPEQLRNVWGLERGPGRWISLQFERWLIRRADSIIGSRGLASHIRSIDPGKAVFECNFSGQDPRPRNEELAKSLGIYQHPTVVYTGNFASYQGVKLLLKAAAMVREKNPNIKFVLVGGTETEINQLNPWIEKNNLGHNVKLNPRVSRKDIPDYLALADVLVLSRIRGENVPFKIYDYLKCGKPIVATKIPAHTTVLSDETAILVEPNPRGMAEGLILALQDNDVAKRLALAARNSLLLEKLVPLRESILKAYQFIHR